MGFIVALSKCGAAFCPILHHYINYCYCFCNIILLMLSSQIHISVPTLSQCCATLGHGLALFFYTSTLLFFIQIFWIHLLTLSCVSGFQTISCQIVLLNLTCFYNQANCLPSKLQKLEIYIHLYYITTKTKTLKERVKAQCISIECIYTAMSSRAEIKYSILLNLTLLLWNQTRIICLSLLHPTKASLIHLCDVTPQPLTLKIPTRWFTPKYFLPNDLFNQLSAAGWRTMSIIGIMMRSGASQPQWQAAHLGFIVPIMSSGSSVRK